MLHLNCIHYYVFSLINITELWTCLHVGEATQFRSQLGEESAIGGVALYEQI